MSRSVENLNNSSSDNERDKESGAKGGLISESFHFSSNLEKMGAKAHTPERLFFRLDSTQGSDLAHILWDLSQNENFLILSHL